MVLGSAVASSRWRALVRAVFDRLPARVKRAILFIRRHGRPARLRHPKTWTEKVNWRILNDRSPWIAESCDKLALKAAVQGRSENVRIPPVLWHGRDLSELVDVDLPEYWVLKPNHAAGLVCFGKGVVNEEGVSNLEVVTAGWLSFDKYRRDGEWGYRWPERTFLVEPMIGGGPHPPNDFKGYVFGGRLAFWHLDIDRGRGQTRAFLDRDGKQFEAWMRYPPAGPVEAPDRLDRMNEAAEQIAGDLDFARVDLYLADEEIWFGELTAYPGSGLEAPGPAGMDERWGELWEMADQR